MNNLSSYCGLTDSRMKASDTDLPLQANRDLRNPDLSFLNQTKNYCDLKPFEEIHYIAFGPIVSWGPWPM